MKVKVFALSSLFGLCCSAFGQMVEFNFAGGSLSDSANTSNILVSNISTQATGGTDGFNAFTSSSGWDSAAQISGADNFFSSPTSLAAAGDAIVFTISAQSGFTFSITDFSFQARSTSTAPADIGFTIIDDTYDFSSDYSNEGEITTISEDALGFSGLSSATISIQGWNASSSGSLQLDNILVSGAVSPVPESSTFALLAGILALASVMFRRRAVK